MKKLIYLSLLELTLLSTGCSHTVSATSSSVVLDGTKVDYSKMDQYIKSEQCIQRDSSGTVSIIEAAKKAGIVKIVHVDKSVHGGLRCAIVYGKGK